MTSASERLRALGEDNRDPALMIGAALLVMDALPQIVAVVEALEEPPGMAAARDPEAYKQWYFGTRRAALVALRDALEEK